MYIIEERANEQFIECYKCGSSFYVDWATGINTEFVDNNVIVVCPECLTAEDLNGEY